MIYTISLEYNYLKVYVYLKGAIAQYERTGGVW